MALDNQDLERIERVFYKNSDDIAVSIASSFEPMKLRIDGAEYRLCARLKKIEDILESEDDDIYEPDCN